VAQFRLAWICSVINLAINDQAATHAAARIRVENRIKVLTGPVMRLCQRGEIRVVFHTDRYLHDVLQPNPKIYLVPSIDLMRTINLTRSPIDWASETNPHSPPLQIAPPLQGAFNVTPDASRALLRIYYQTLPMEDMNGRCSSHKLEFCAPNLQAQKQWFFHQCHSRPSWCRPSFYTSQLLIWRTPRWDFAHAG
jgi:hypothetical protein